MPMNQFIYRKSIPNNPNMNNKTTKSRAAKRYGLVKFFAEF